MKYDRMKKDVKKTWLTALRSGDYKQGRGSLVQVDKKGSIIGHCCLGVLQNLNCQQRGVKFRPKDYEYGEHNVKTEKWSGLSRDNEIPSGGVVTRLQEMNDGLEGAFIDVSQKPRSFKQIANWIEHNL